MNVINLNNISHCNEFLRVPFILLLLLHCVPQVQSNYFIHFTCNNKKKRHASYIQRPELFSHYQVFQGSRQRETQWTSSEPQWTAVGSSRCFWPALPVLVVYPVPSSRRSKPVRPQNTMGDHWAWVSAYPIPATRYCDPSHAGESSFIFCQPSRWSTNDPL